jgi:hypothetical protein
MTQTGKADVRHQPVNYVNVNWGGRFQIASEQVDIIEQTANARDAKLDPSW